MNAFIVGLLAGLVSGGAAMAYLTHSLHVDLVSAIASEIAALRADIAALQAKL